MSTKSNVNINIIIRDSDSKSRICNFHTKTIKHTNYDFTIPYSKGLDEAFKSKYCEIWCKVGNGLCDKVTLKKKDANTITLNKTWVNRGKHGAVSRWKYSPYIGWYPTRPITDLYKEKRYDI